MPTAHDRYNKPRPPFGAWLLEQKARTDAIGELARAAAGDAGFPRDGDAKAISARLNRVQADPAMHVALEDAELDWACI